MNITVYAQGRGPPLIHISPWFVTETMSVTVNMNATNLSKADLGTCYSCNSQDVIREGGGPAGEDDKIYYFFTEVSVEYEFFGKLFIPRVARVCKVGRRARQRARQRARHCARHCARHPRPASRPPPLPSASSFSSSSDSIGG